MRGWILPAPVDGASHDEIVARIFQLHPLGLTLVQAKKRDSIPFPTLCVLTPRGTASASGRDGPILPANGLRNKSAGGINAAWPTPQTLLSQSMSI
jgi:hypothetical protein